MKSSSSLFPVALMRAEALSSEYIEDTYLLKPNNSPDPTVQVALSRLGKYQAQDSDRGQPVILVHGSFSNRGIWLDSQLQGMARLLIDAGLDPWMLEMRGHGDSPENAQYQKNDIESYATYDLPAVQSFIVEQTNKKVVWLGHSSGGVAIATALAGKYLKQEQILGVALFGSQVSKYPLALSIPFLRSYLKLHLLFKKRILNTKLGPELEPKGVAKEFIRWSGLLSRWKSKKGFSYWKGLSEVSVPSIGFGAKKDSGDPAKYCEKLINHFSGDKVFHHLSKAKGFSQDYNHGNMVRGERAASEVWPILIQWLDSISHKH